MDIDLMALAPPTRPLAGRSPRRRDDGRRDKQHQQQGSRAHATTTDFDCYSRLFCLHMPRAMRSPS